MSSVLHEGPPFKFKAVKHDHQNFVQCVRFSPNGSIYVTASADKRILAYDAKEGASAGEFKDGATAHSGSVYAVCFSPDSSKLLSVSADKSAKIWNVESYELLKTFKFGNNVSDMQVGCLWQGDHIITLSLDGELTYLDLENVDKPKRKVRGHNKKITSICYIKGNGGDLIYTGDFLGNINCWDCATGNRRKSREKRRGKFQLKIKKILVGCGFCGCNWTDMSFYCQNSTEKGSESDQKNQQGRCQLQKYGN